MTANLLSAAIFTPILGRVGDTFGKKRTLVGVLLALAIGSLLAAIAPTIGVLIAARVIQGAARAVFPLSYAIIRDEFRAERVASAVGTISAVIAAGDCLGIVLAVRSSTCSAIPGCIGSPWWPCWRRYRRPCSFPTRAFATRPHQTGSRPA